MCKEEKKALFGPDLSWIYSTPSLVKDGMVIIK